MPRKGRPKSFAADQLVCSCKKLDIDQRAYHDCTCDAVDGTKDGLFKNKGRKRYRQVHIMHKR